MDSNNERYHILGCCCNCAEFDQVCESLVCCVPVKKQKISNMLLTFQDRLRIPWRGGAKQISFDAVIPVFVIPLAIGLGSINIYCWLLVTTSMIAFLIYFYQYLQKHLPKSRFFFMWTLWSVIYLLLLFELIVPLFELLPEENCILVILVCLSIFFAFKTRKKAPLNIVMQSFASEDDLPDITEEQSTILIDHPESDESDCHPNMCQICRKYVPPRTYHCVICQACVTRRNHHSVWLNCCIGASNQKYFLFALLFGFSALFLGANLILTSVCHPFLLFQVFGIHILLPDDCSEVFEEYEMGLSFVISIYSTAFGLLILLTFVLQLYLISKGVTYIEWRLGRKGNRKPICWNWKDFCTRGT